MIYLNLQTASNNIIYLIFMDNITIIFWYFNAQKINSLTILKK